MATIPEMLARWKSINLQSEVPKIIQNTSDEMVRLNRKQLYTKGIKSDGERLAPYRSILYAQEKNMMNPSPGLFNPDLFLTGKFQRGFYAQVKSGNSVIFGSTDSKSASLEAKYTKEIFGLTKDNKRVYLDTSIMPGIRSYITRQTGLNFR